MEELFVELLAEIAERLNDDWTDINMAKRVGLSVSRFCTLFKELTGNSPKAYLKEARLQKAKHLIETTTEHIDQIGFNVGMCDPSHFSRNFKIKFKRTPTEHRKQYEENRVAELLKQHPELKKLPGFSKLVEE